MPFDQTQPQRLPELVEAFAQTARAIVDLARACSDDDLAQPTECPGWTVHDQISHVAGVEAWLAGHQDPRVQVPPYEHIRNDLGKKVEYAVEVRRGRTGAEVLAELEDLLAQRLQTLRDPMLTDTSIIAGPFGPDQAATVMLLRTFDVWTHEQDIRSALGRRQVFIMSTFLSMVHAIAEDSLVFIALGASVFWVVAYRIVWAALVTLALTAIATVVVRR